MIYKNLDGTTRTSFSLGTPSSPILRLGHFIWDEKNTSQVNAGTTMVAYQTWTTPSLPRGIYVLTCNFLWQHATANRTLEFEILIDGAQVWLCIERNTVAATTRTPVSNTHIAVLTQGVHVIGLRFRPQVAGNLTLFRNLFTLMRVR